jgi:acyl-CoA synthetase (AMP-forming)/AMP-acid ligase II
MPLYHSTATIMGFSHILEAGATLAIGRKFSTKTYWKEVRHYDATMIQYVGETLRYLLTAPPELDPVTGENLDQKHRVRMAFGNGLRPDVWERFRERFGIDCITEMYGATEGFLATWNKSRNSYSAGAIGRSGWFVSQIMGRGVRIIDVDSATDSPVRDPATGLCREVPRGSVGEMMFHILDIEAMETQYQGYYNNKEATSSKVLRDVLTKGDAFFRSGDLVSWDNEGRMYFHDRMGDTFRWKSENVATMEVSHMMGLHPSVHEANVYGVELPHHEGRAGCVAISLKDAAETTMRSLAAHARKTLPKYAVPVFLRVVDDVGGNVTGTNKQQKHELRAQGVDPSKVGNDQLWWLQPGREMYEPFVQRDWQQLVGGGVKL